MASVEIKKPAPQPEPEDVILRLTKTEAGELRRLVGDTPTGPGPTSTYPIGRVFQALVAAGIKRPDAR